MSFNFKAISKIRYIKLGVGGAWAKECFDKKIIRLGFDSGNSKVHAAAISGDWNAIYQYWTGRTGTPKAHSNQTRTFFEDKGDTLWVTFHDGYLYYTVADMAQPVADSPTSSYKKTCGIGWSNKDVNGKPLTVEYLSGALTKTAAYRQTICKFSSEVEKYIKRVIAAKSSPDVIAIESLRKNLLEHVARIINNLGDKDFELLVSLIFSNSGWRRISAVGGNQKMTDISLENPVTGDLAFVQVKSQTTQEMLDDYLSQKRDSGFSRMFYVYHRGHAESREEDVSIWNVDYVSRQVLSNGLLDWVIAKAH